MANMPITLISAIFLIITSSLASFVSEKEVYIIQ